jgi:hypothetical protein
MKNKDFLFGIILFAGHCYYTVYEKVSNIISTIKVKYITLRYPEIKRLHELSKHKEYK